MKISKAKKTLKSISFSNILKCLKKNRMKIAALIMAVITVTASFPAYGLSSGNSTTVNEEWNNDIEYNISGWNDANGDHHNSMWGKRIALFSIKSTGEPVYCLEPDVTADVSKTATTISNFEGTAAWKKLSATAKIIVIRASIYGYDGTSATRYGYSAVVAQTATQIIIWDTLCITYKSYIVQNVYFTKCTNNGSFVCASCETYKMYTSHKLRKK